MIFQGAMNSWILYLHTSTIYEILKQHNFDGDSNELILDALILSILMKMC